MVNDGDAVPRGMNIELDPVDAKVEGPLEGWPCVFRRLAISPPVGNDFGSPDHKSKIGSESNYQN